MLDRKTRLAVIERSNAVVYLIAIATRSGGRTMGSWVGTVDATGVTREYVGNFDWILDEITSGTGGRLYDLEPGGSFADSLAEAMNEFRNRYLLRYRPTGIEIKGWHELSVKVPTGRYDVRARKGYFGG